MQAPITTTIYDAYSPGYGSPSQRSQQAPADVQYRFDPAMMSGDGSMGMEIQAPITTTAPPDVQYRFGPAMMSGDGSMGMEMQAPITTTVATTSIARTAQTPSYMPELVATTLITRYRLVLWMPAPSLVHH